MIFWEDFTVGESAEMGRHTFSEEEILEFGRRYDPQPFHCDPAAARASSFGGLIASGWQTCAIGMRLMVESYLRSSNSLGSPGVDSVRWLKPVRPGDTLTYTRTVLETRASSSRPGIGLVKQRWEAVNQNAELVLTMEGWGMFGTRSGR
jgi:acyl dehydratase